MKNLLNDCEYEDFLTSYEKCSYSAVRVNTLKISIQQFLNIFPGQLTQVPWATDGFYYDREKITPGKHPYYYAGLYYIQDPSAMFPAAVLKTLPGERVLDLCAAPGGKTVQLAGGLGKDGVIVANDINTSRIKALIKNIELMGIKNAVVTNESPETLSLKFYEYFDKILVDAPCSGEGMFRKDPNAHKSWSKFNQSRCTIMQKNIMNYVDRMLKPGGYIVYSTCTFSPEENEQIIEYFLDRHKIYEVIDIPKKSGIEDGRPEWGNGTLCLSKAARLWPHKINGEGHFVTLLRKNGEPQNFRGSKVVNNSRNIPGIEHFYDFSNRYLSTLIDGHFGIFGNNLYLMPINLSELSGLKVSKFGWYLGSLSSRGFEPSHAMCMALQKSEIKNFIEFKSDDYKVIRYLKGETLTDINLDVDGLIVTCVDGYPLGWGKKSGDSIKNLYPKGWRYL